MKNSKKPDRPIAKELSAAELDRILKKVGKLIKAMRKERTTLEDFVYEIRISRSAMNRFEDGSDMYLSSFLKVLYGLDISPEDFFKELK